MKIEILSGEEFSSFKSEVFSKLEEVTRSIRHIKNNNGWCLESDAMKILGVSKSSIQKFRRANRLPFAQIDRKIYYKLEDLNNFINQNYSKNEK